MTTDIDDIAQSDVDPRPRQLLDRYLKMAGGSLTLRGPHLADVVLPQAERVNFGGAPAIVVAFTPDAILEDSNAQLLTTGSELLRQLVGAIQRRGALESYGLLNATLESSATASAPPAKLEQVALSETEIKKTIRPIGRLLARVTIHAGPAMVEQLLETDVIDLTSGGLLDPAVVAQLLASVPNENSPADSGEHASQILNTMPLLMARLADQASSEISRLEREADLALRTELGRLTAYYEKMISDAEDSSAADESVKEKKAAIRADRDRRKKEEEFRFAVRVAVHPVQLTQWLVPAEEVCWTLLTAKGRRAQIASSRILLGGGNWALTCPSCGAAVEIIRVCRHEHVCCARCSVLCLICNESCCVGHNAQQCQVGNHPVCDDHSLRCRSCDSAYCDAHSAFCETNDHKVCADCAERCSRCARVVCKSHATQSAANKVREARWLCRGCAVYCEGGQNEPVGLDEVARCATCDRYICVEHQARCAVDGMVHCSKHLRRSDRSGRLVCEKHRAECADEPRSILALDEVAACTSCGRSVCEAHSGTCAFDSLKHCVGHLKPVRGPVEELLCQAHRVECSVDGASHRPTDVTVCPVCGSKSCAEHKTSCGYCGRLVCSRDADASMCKTCKRLAPIADPSDDLIQTGLVANSGEPMKSGVWRSSQDAGNTVVEVNQGWSRKLVFTVKHGESEPETVIRHSLLGSKRIR